MAAVGKEEVFDRSGARHHLLHSLTAKARRPRRPALRSGGPIRLYSRIRKDVAVGYIATSIEAARRPWRKLALLLGIQERIMCASDHEFEATAKTVTGSRGRDHLRVTSAFDVELRSRESMIFAAV